MLLLIAGNLSFMLVERLLRRFYAVNMSFGSGKNREKTLNSYFFNKNILLS